MISDPKPYVKSIVKLHWFVWSCPMSIKASGLVVHFNDTIVKINVIISFRETNCCTITLCLMDAFSKWLSCKDNNLSRKISRDFVVPRRAGLPIFAIIAVKEIVNFEVIAKLSGYFVTKPSNSSEISWIVGKFQNFSRLISW